MTTEAPERTEELPVAAPDAPEAPSETREDAVRRPVNPLLTSAAVFLSASAAGWMCAGIFRGGLAKGVGLLGPAIGAGAVALSYRTRRPSLIQYLALPAAIAAGALLVIPDATGGTANLPGLVAEAIRTGGVAQPPIAFDPGWRFILVVLTAVLATAGASLATGLNRPKLGIFLPVPLVFAAALVQPKDGSTLTTAVALGLVVAALAVAYGVELASEGATSGQFEFRRLGRGAGVVAVLMIALFGLAQAGFLFPETDRDQVVPPKRPEVQPPQADRVIFTVDAERTLPWRFGVLDVYQDNAWMLPPFDTSRFLEIGPDGTIPDPPDAPAIADRETLEATFTVADIEGHVIPTIAFAQAVQRDDFLVDADPRTQMLRLPDVRARSGMTYTVTASVPPDAAALAEAPEPGPEFAEFLEAPEPPSEVLVLLQQAPTDNRFERLQFVRNTFFQSVIAAGQGEPVDLPPTRVVDMLEGGEATPYEITAAEALLARWAGIPARIGYGFFGGEKTDPSSQTFEVRPKHGSTWLEAYFGGIGWVPILGTPPRAKSSISEQERNPDPEIRPTEELALTVYVPIKLQSIQLLFVVVRYWLAVTMPIVAGALLIWSFFPGPLKAARRFVRRRRASGPAERVVTAYAEFRDVANDLNVSDPTATPLEFLGAIEPDAEHGELAWLVTRAIWGDLTRDLRTEDAEAAEDMAASVARRLRRGQPAITRVLGYGSRASLRDPYTDEVPNLWPGWARPGALRRGLRPLRLIRRLLPIGGLLAMLLAASCGGSSDVSTVAGLLEPVLPQRIAPESLEGLRFEREPNAEAAYETVGDEGLVAVGRVFTVREDDIVQGALQVGAFKPGLEATDREIREGVLGDIGSGNFELTRIGNERIFVQELPEQTIYLWFPPRLEYYEVFVASKGFERADRVFAAVLAYQRGEEISEALTTSRGPLDPRRGGPE